MRCRATQWTPRFSQRLHLFHSRARLQSETDPHRLLYSKITGGPCVTMPKAEQQIDVRGPWADAMQLRQRRVRGIGVFFSQYVEVETLVAEFSRDELRAF